MCSSDFECDEIRPGHGDTYRTDVQVAVLEHMDLDGTGQPRFYPPTLNGFKDHQQCWLVTTVETLVQGNKHL